MGGREGLPIVLNLGGRLLLTLLAIDILLLTILGILEAYGNIKNGRNRGEVPSSDSLWPDASLKRRAKFDGLEILEADSKQVPTRLSVRRARYVSADTGILIGNRYEPIGGNRVIVHLNERVTEPIRHREDELSTPADSIESLTHSLVSQ